VPLLDQSQLLSLTAIRYLATAVYSYKKIAFYISARCCCCIRLRSELQNLCYCRDINATGNPLEWIFYIKFCALHSCIGNLVMALVHRLVWKPFPIVTVTLSMWNPNLLVKPIFLIRKCYCIDIFSHFPLQLAASFWCLFSRVCMSVFCDNSCLSARKPSCSYQFIGFLRRRTFRVVNDWRHSCQLCYVSCSIARRSEFATKSSQSSCRTETHLCMIQPAWFNKADQHDAQWRTNASVSWYMLRPVAVSGSRLRSLGCRPAYLTCVVPAASRVTGRRYRVGFTVLPRFFWKRVINRRCTRWFSWLGLCAASWKVAGSVLHVTTGIFHWHNSSGRTVALGSTQSVTEMRTMSLG
jgi:hypothetical protein